MSWSEVRRHARDYLEVCELAREVKRRPPEHIRLLQSHVWVRPALQKGLHNSRIVEFEESHPNVAISPLAFITCVPPRVSSCVAA